MEKTMWEGFGGDGSETELVGFRRAAERRLCGRHLEVMAQEEVVKTSM